jgi:hypothetical protein
MILFWVLWVSLVLGGVAGYLCARARGTGLGLRTRRQSVRVRPPASPREAGTARCRPGREDFLPVPRVTTRPGSPPGPGA